MNFDDIIQQIDSVILILSNQDGLDFADLESIYNILDKFDYQNLSKTEAETLLDKISAINSLIESKKTEMLNKLENKNKELELLNDIKRNIRELINIS
ncbi:MAG: hypothetical protein ABWJ98_06410 [Hydrogenothermaceae bacterium]